LSVVFRRRVDHAVERDDVNAIMTFLTEMDAKLDEILLVVREEDDDGEGDGVDG
jgi:hypothetical protein